VSISFLVSTGAVTCYRAVNSIWFRSTDEKCSSCQHLATWGREIRRLAILKLNHFASGVCWCTVLLEGVKVKLFSQVCKMIILGVFVAAVVNFNSL